MDNVSRIYFEGRTHPRNSLTFTLLLKQNLCSLYELIDRIRYLSEGSDKLMYPRSLVKGITACTHNAGQNQAILDNLHACLNNNISSYAMCNRAHGR